MRRIWISISLGLLLVAVLGLTVYSQTAPVKVPAVQMLQSGISQTIPLDVTLLVPSESGVQTITVPLLLNLSLSVGPVEAIDMNVTVEQTSPFASPLTTVAPLAPSEEITTTAAMTTTP